MPKIVLITGTSTGIGESTALHLAREGYHVYAGMRTTSAGDDLLKTATGEDLFIKVLQQDVCDSESNQMAVDEVLTQSGTIDVLINNAGIGGGASFEETTPETFRSLMETNFFGAVDLTQRVLPVLRQKREGCIINVTSVAGVTSFCLNTAYSASKWALEAATETLAMEMQEFGVRVALIEPGVVLTPIFSKAETTDRTESAYKKFYERLNRYFEYNLQRPTMPIAVAELIQEAIETKTPKLRYLIGPDAESLMKARSSTSDEEWIGIGRMSDSEWRAYAAEYLDMQL